MVKETGLYDELGLSPDATEQQIRSAYRSMALKYHPDKNNGDAAAAEKFKKVAEAYEILSDADRRKQYDMFGRNGSGVSGAAADAGGFPGGFGPGMDPMDIFSHFFGFGGGASRTDPQQQQQKPPFILVELQCSLEELYCGTTKILQVKRRRICTKCHGYGTANGKAVPVCPRCKGRKFVNRQINLGGLMTFQQVCCEYCQGRGKMPITAACAKCGPVFETYARSQAMGNTKDPMPRGVVLQETQMKVTIAPGTEDSDAISFVKQGDELPGFETIGDILVVIEQLPHPCYRRLNNTDLFLCNCRVPLWRLFHNSFTLPIELLDGRVVRLTPPRCESDVPRFLFDSQHVFVVENEGMPVKQPRDAAADNGRSINTAELKKGKLYVCIDVVFPSSLTPSQVTAIADALGCSPADLPSQQQQQQQQEGRVLSLQPYYGPAPSWHQVDAQGNASYKADGTKKKKKKTTTTAR